MKYELDDLDLHLLKVIRHSLASTGISTLVDKHGTVEVVKPLDNDDIAEALQLLVDIVDAETADDLDR